MVKKFLLTLDTFLYVARIHGCMCRYEGYPIMSSTLLGDGFLNISDTRYCGEGPSVSGTQSYNRYPTISNARVKSQTQLIRISEVTTYTRLIQVSEVAADYFGGPRKPDPTGT